jgi:hypothetical protein
VGTWVVLDSADGRQRMSFIRMKSMSSASRARACVVTRLAIDIEPRFN